MLDRKLFVMLNDPAVCSIHAHAHSSVKLLPESIFHLLIVQNESNLVALFSYFSRRAIRAHTTYPHVVVVSKTIPTITMKPTDQNGLSLSLSPLLTPIVPLLSSLSLSHLLSCVSISFFLSLRQSAFVCLHADMYNNPSTLSIFCAAVARSYLLHLYSSFSTMSVSCRELERTKKKRQNVKLILPMSNIHCSVVLFFSYTY